MCDRSNPIVRYAESKLAIRLGHVPRTKDLVMACLNKLNDYALYCVVCKEWLMDGISILRDVRRVPHNFIAVKSLRRIKVSFLHLKICCNHQTVSLINSLWLVGLEKSGGISKQQL